MDEKYWIEKKLSNNSRSYIFLYIFKKLKLISFLYEKLVIEFPFYFETVK